MLNYNRMNLRVIGGGDVGTEHLAIVPLLLRFLVTSGSSKVADLNSSSFS
jgi:hypothetical protein